MINRLSITNKKIIIILVIGAILVPLIVFIFASMSSPTPSNPEVPAKTPLPTFPDAPRVEGELIIQYSQGQEFDKLSPQRQQEITALFESLGVISQEKAYPEATEGELSRSYLLKIDENADIESVAQKIYELPEIEGAQPNTEFGLF